jgi:hypothetical protein
MLVGLLVFLSILALTCPVIHKTPQAPTKKSKHECEKSHSKDVEYYFPHFWSQKNKSENIKHDFGKFHSTNFFLHLNVDKS